MKTLSALLALLILLPGLSCAGQLTVAPIRLTLAPNQANATFTLTNNASSEGFYQL